nr:MAG: ORF1 [TTV-like mini virus]
MPWNYRWRPYYRRRRRWRFYRRRPRATFRRRWRRRVRYPKRKLKRLKITQWQPSSIRKCKVKGLSCLFLCNANRLGHNLAMYNQSLVPEHLPGGGGFSIYQYTLDNLYTMHQYVRNWWTKSNKELPLVRFLYAKFTLYQSEDVDYVFRYQRHFPMTSGQLTYPSMQPSLLMMLNHSIIVPSKRTKRLRKGYKKITIKPPEVFSNKWYFQQKIATIPLLVTQTVACSLDHYYINTQGESNNVTINCLNTSLIQNRELGKNSPYPIRYDGTQSVWLWASDHAGDDTTQPKLKTLTLLAYTNKYYPGFSYEHALKQPQKPTNWKAYVDNIAQWGGNPFHSDYLNPKSHELYTLYHSRGKWEDVLKPNGATSDDTAEKPATGLTKIHNPLIIPCRYNPNTDKGDTNSTYLLKNFQHEWGWEPYPDNKLQLTGFPLWINWWGFIDFQKQQHVLTGIDTKTIMVTKTNQLHPIYDAQLPVFVPINRDYIEGKSPYETDVNPADYNRWFPMVQYQENAINDLLKSGPGTAKVEPKTTVEAKCKYEFVFKFGGNPAPMVELKDPTEQPYFPIPNNIIDTTSLQDPTTPSELFLYNFDERRGIITKNAATRISKDWQTKKTLFTDGGATPTAPPIQQKQQTLSEETSDSEKEDETLFEEFLRQRYKQQQLKHRIKELLQKMKDS